VALGKMTNHVEMEKNITKSQERKKERKKENILYTVKKKER
jgi:hypothetical protein